MNYGMYDFHSKSYTEEDELNEMGDSASGKTTTEYNPPPLPQRPVPKNIGRKSILRVSMLAVLNSSHPIKASF